MSYSESEDELETTFSAKKILEEQNLQLGDNVVVTSGERPFAAILADLLPDQLQCKVIYYEFNYAEAILPLESIMSLREYISLGSSGDIDILHHSQVSPGFVCYCKYSADQMYYLATVNKEVVLPMSQEITERRGHSYEVTYNEYGNTEVVPLEHLSIKKPDAAMKSMNDVNAAAALKKEKKKSEESSPTQLIKIPESLKIKPTDTEEVRSELPTC